jgi:deoxycytidine triphosphate deaminase
MIESHATYKDYKAVIEEKKLSIELLEKTEKTLSSTTYDIKNLIEIMKLEMT